MRNNDRKPESSANGTPASRDAPFAEILSASFAVAQSGDKVLCFVTVLRVAEHKVYPCRMSAESDSGGERVLLTYLLLKTTKTATYATPVGQNVYSALQFGRIGGQWLL